MFCYCLCFEYCDECLLSFGCGACLDVAGVRGGCPTQFFFFIIIFLKVNTHHSNYMYNRKKIPFYSLQSVFTKYVSDISDVVFPPIFMEMLPI